MGVSHVVGSAVLALLISVIFAVGLGFLVFSFVGLMYIMAPAAILYYLILGIYLAIRYGYRKIRYKNRLYNSEEMWEFINQFGGEHLFRVYAEDFFKSDVTEIDSDGHVIKFRMNAERKFLPELKPGIFSPFKHLKVLSLKGLFELHHVYERYTVRSKVASSWSKRPISGLTSDLFTGLEQLEELDIGSNTLSVLPSNVLEHLPNLKRLNLQDNELTILPYELSLHAKLLRLDLSKNKFKELPPEVLDLSSLEYLNLRETKLHWEYKKEFRSEGDLEKLRGKARGEESEEDDNTKIIYCQQCGSQVQAKFCTKCGNKL